jgi:hypothetical protein
MQEKEEEKSQGLSLRNIPNEKERLKLGICDDTSG